MSVSKFATSISAGSAYRKFKPGNDGEDISSSFSFVSARVARPKGTPPDVSNIISRRKKVDASGNIIKTSGWIGTAWNTIKGIGKNTAMYGLPAFAIGMGVAGSGDAVNPANTPNAQEYQPKVPASTQLPNQTDPNIAGN